MPLVPLLLNTLLYNKLYTILFIIEFNICCTVQYTVLNTLHALKGGLLTCFVANYICYNLRTFSGKIFLAQTMCV